VKLSVTISGLARLFGDDLAAVVDAARIADEVGVHQVVLPDHVAIGPRLDRYPFGREFPYPPDEPWLEPLTTLAAIAGATERVRLGTGILVAPLRPALVLAKSVATLDVLSRGRVELGVGVGWQREEFTQAGQPFAGRAARLDDTVRACRALWEQEPPVTFASGTVSFTDLWCEPRPVQARVPVWFGAGPSDATIGRIAELGDGWLPLGVERDVLAATVVRLRDAFSARGRDPDGLGVLVGLPVVQRAGRVDLGATVAPLPGLASAGVTTVSVGLGRNLANRADLEPFLRDLAAAFH
jgi:probable F420-dependent oxidoreductase